MTRKAEKHLAKSLATLMKRTGHNLNSTASRAERSAFIADVLHAWNEAVEIDEAPHDSR